MSINVFSDNATTRIKSSVKYTEQLRNSGRFDIMHPDREENEIVYLRLKSKDPNDLYGYWEATEVRQEEGIWEDYDDGKQFNDEEYPYIRHLDWDDANEGDIVKAFITYDLIEDQITPTWVFKGAVTNPEAFVFYADENGGQGQATYDSEWNMPRGGKVLTNVGELDVNGDHTMFAGEEAYCQIVFNKVDGEWQIASAAMTSSSGPFWEEVDDTLIVFWRIAKAEVKGDLCRLEQYHAGDIHLSIFTNTVVKGGDAWTTVTQNDGEYTVYHDLPATQEYHQDEILAMTGECDDVPYDSFESFISWFVDHLAHYKYDKRGHIYEKETCYGDIDNYDPDDPTTDPSLDANLEAAAVAAQIYPWDVATDGVTTTYTLSNGGNNFPDFVGAEKNMTLITNSQGQIIQIADDVGGPAVPIWSAQLTKPFENVNGTSGKQYTELQLHTTNFRFNDTITVKSGTVNKGLGDQVVLDTAVVTVDIAATDPVRNYDDPEATTQPFYAIYGTAGFDGYTCQMRFLYGDGTPVQYRLNQGDNWSTEIISLPITGTESQHIDPEFNFNDDVTPGDSINVTVNTIAPDGITDANISHSELVYVNLEDDCVKDENGDNVYDENGECAEEDATDVPYVYPDIYYFRFTITTTEFILTSTGDTFSIDSDDIVKTYNGIDTSNADQTYNSSVATYRNGAAFFQFRHYVKQKDDELYYNFGGSVSQDSELDMYSTKVTTQTSFIHIQDRQTFIDDGNLVDRDFYITVEVRRDSQGDSPF